MKTIVFFFVLLCAAIAPAQTKSTKLIASNCESRGCTGSSGCSACKNCSGCKHCAKEGGSCGVCSGGSTKTKTVYKSSSSNEKRKNFYTRESSGFSDYYVGKLLATTVQNVKLRKGPGTNYEAIEVLDPVRVLLYMNTTGDWIRVRLENTETVGYVNFKYIK